MSQVRVLLREPESTKPSFARAFLFMSPDADENLSFRGAMDTWWVYLVDKGDRLYTGITTDLENRMRQHGQSMPLYNEGPMSRSAAVLRERELKGWNRRKKLALVVRASERT
jgi:predicted GIY-YIG superfamily endonuclease